MATTSTSSRFKPRAWLTLLLLVLAVGAGNVLADPPSRVARLSVLRGDVSFAPAGEDNWYSANLNRPLVSGDKLYTDRDARAELDIGAVTVRLDERSSFSILDLDDRTAQLELTQGTLNLRVHKLYGDQRYEVDTPTLAFVISQPGEYRIDIAARGDTTQVTVFDGAGDVFGESGARYRVDQRQSYRFNDSRLRDVAVQDLPRPDDFDNWCFARDDHYDNSPSRRYVSDEVIGVADLDEYGAWDDMPDYGTIWFPARVAYGWAPYRDGHWAWIDPWGWTWVDNAPWGFAPFHYGRWVYVGNRWGWLPGPVTQRPVYAPALVVFVGGSGWHAGHARGGAPIGWCPLGPRDVYVPPYRVSRGYFTHINASNSPVIDHEHIGSSYEHYAHGQPDHDRDSAYRHNPAAVTAVSRDTFVHARPVADGRLHLNDAELAHAEIDHDITPPPTTASLIPSTEGAHAAVPHEPFHRGVIAHMAPPPPAAPFTARLRAIERNGGRPLPDRELHQINARHSIESRDAAPQRVQVISPATTPVLIPAPVSVERASTSRESTSVAPRNASDSPTSQPDNPRTDEHRSPAAGGFTRERGAAAPVQFERRNDAAPPAEDNSNRTQQRHTRRDPGEAAPASVDKPPARPAEPAPHTDRRSRENSAPPRQHQAPRNHPPSPPQHAPDAGREHVERGKDTSPDNGNVSQQPGAPGR